MATTDEDILRQAREMLAIKITGKVHGELDPKARVIPEYRDDLCVIDGCKNKARGTHTYRGHPICAQHHTMIARGQPIPDMPNARAEVLKDVREAEAFIATQKATKIPWKDVTVDQLVKEESK